MSGLMLQCDDCEGSGTEMVHRPQHDDPYLMVKTRNACPFCDGTGEVPRLCDDCGEASATLFNGRPYCDECLADRTTT